MVKCMVEGMDYGGLFGGGYGGVYGGVVACWTGLSPGPESWTSLRYGQIVFVFGNPPKVSYTYLLNAYLPLKCVCGLP